MFIDIHVHVRKYPALVRGDRQQAYNTPEQLVKRYDELGVEAGVLLPGVNPECTLQPQGNEEVLDISKTYPGRFIPFCNLDPRTMSNSAEAPLSNILSYYKEEGFKGIGEVCANLPFLHPMMLNLFKHVEAVGFPLTFHVAAQIGSIYGVYDDPGLPQLERVLQMFPKLKFLAHSQSFWAEIGKLETPAARYGYPKHQITEEGVVPKLFRRYPNLHGDLSAGSGCNALARDPEYGVKFLNEFQDRLLFGTDICHFSMPFPMVDLLLAWRDSKKISEQVFNKIARENAVKLFGLS